MCQLHRIQLINFQHLLAQRWDSHAPSLQVVSFARFTSFLANQLFLVGYLESPSLVDGKLFKYLSIDSSNALRFSFHLVIILAFQY